MIQAFFCISLTVAISVIITYINTSIAEDYQPTDICINCTRDTCMDKIDS